MATNPRVPDYESGEERKQPQLVPNTDWREPKSRKRPVSGLLIGILIAAALLAITLFFWARMSKNAFTPAAAQGSAQGAPVEVQLQGMQLIAGPNDESFYLDGNIMNAGTHAITGIVAEVKLRNVENQVILDVQRPMQGMAVKDHSLEENPLAQDPIKPSTTRAVRLVLSKVPSDWNHNLPDIEVVTVTTTPAQ